MKVPPIITISTYYEAPVGYFSQPAMWVVVDQWPRGIPVDYPTETGGDPVLPVVNHNRWMAECRDCENPQLVDPSDPRFFCTSCLNVANGCRFRPVDFPPPVIRHQIEEALLPRPLPYRNWLADESVADLLAENREHGIKD